ncbi:hypothetical protein QEN19_002860 [Hanseniaspora menglaensis]
MSNNNLSFTPFNTTPGTNKLLFEGTGGETNDDSGTTNNDNNLNYGSRTPFQVIPMEFDSLRKYSFNDSGKNNTVFNSGGDNLNLSILDTNLSISTNKLKMPQVERRAKRHFHESFMDSFDASVMNEFSDEGKVHQNTLQQPIPSNMLFNKIGKPKTGITRSAGHLNLSLNGKFKTSKNTDQLPTISQNEINSKQKTLNDKIAAWSFFTNTTELQSNNESENVEKTIIPAEDDADYSNNRKHALPLNLTSEYKETKKPIYRSDASDLTTIEQYISINHKSIQPYSGNRSGISPLPNGSSYWPSSSESNNTAKPWSTNTTSPNVSAYNESYNKIFLNEESVAQTKSKKTSSDDLDKMSNKAPSFINAKPDQTIFNSSKLVSKFSLDSAISDSSNQQSFISNNHSLSDSLYAESLASENSSTNRNRQIVPDTPVKKPINLQMKSSFLRHRNSVFEEDEPTINFKDFHNSKNSSFESQSLKLSFNHTDTRTSKNNTDIYKKSPTNINYSTRASKSTAVSHRNTKTYHKPNNSVTTITTVNSNMSVNASIDTQNTMNRQSMIISSDLSVSLQKLTDDLYGEDDIMDIDQNLDSMTPTKKLSCLGSAEKYTINTKNQFTTPQKPDIQTNKINEKRNALMKSTKGAKRTSLQKPINLEYKENAPTTLFISPDAKQTTSILVKNNEDDMHYSYLISKFSKLEEITSAGSFAKVFKVTKNLSNSKSLAKKANKMDVFAVKCMPEHTNKGSYINVLNEIHILQTVSKYRDLYKSKLHEHRKQNKKGHTETAVIYNGHEKTKPEFEDNIDESLYIFDFITSWKHENGYYIISDYYENGTLNDFIQKQIVNREFKFDDFRIWKIISEICHGLNFLHQHCKIVHLDLKPSNIFVTFEGSLKIGDFGLSTKLPLRGQHFENEGDREYIAPEIIRDSVYDFKADIFSLGLMIVELACNVVLPDNGQVWQRLRSGNISDIGRISSTEINKLLNDTSESSTNSVFDNSRLTPLSSASNFIGTSKLNEIERNTGKSIPAWVPKFLIDGISLDRTVRWMIDPDYKKRPSAKEILFTEECEYVNMTKRSGALVFEGEYGSKLERF